MLRRCQKLKRLARAEGSSKDEIFRLRAELRNKTRPGQPRDESLSRWVKILDRTRRVVTLRASKGSGSMNFVSDNIVGASAPVLDALVRANAGPLPAYG